MVYVNPQQEANLDFMENLLGLQQQQQFCGDDDPLQPLPLGGMASKDLSSTDSYYSNVCKALLDSAEDTLPLFKSVDSFFSFAFNSRSRFNNNCDSTTPPDENVLEQCPASRSTVNDNTSTNRAEPCVLPIPLAQSFSLDMRCRYESIGTIDVDLEVFEQDLKAMEEVGPLGPVTQHSKSVPSIEVGQVVPSIAAPCSTSRAYINQQGATEKRYITDEINLNDVLFGQGGQSNNNHGNVQYRAIVDRIRPIYNTASMADKTTIAQGVVEEIASKGGRFLIKDKNSHQWYLADNRTARMKVSQALREKYITSEERAAKRARYLRNKQ